MAHVPNLPEAYWANSAPVPSTPAILDLIEFCWNCIGKPIHGDYHRYGRHSHLHFDQDEGREELRSKVENIFRRNGIAYQLTEQGRIERLLDPVLHEALAIQTFDTGDAELDSLLVKARSKFLDPNPESRREALEHLWDGWERIKTLEGPGNKANLVDAMLDDTAGPGSPRFREDLGREASNLTWVGNNLLIRHWETDRERLSRNAQVDYLFYRMFSLLQLILRSR